MIELRVKRLIRREHFFKSYSLGISSSRLLSVGVWLAIAIVSFTPVFAQDALQAALRGNSRMTSNQRAELQDILKQHSAVLDAQSAVFKAVAKLVGPSVVHIEADLTPHAGRSYPGRHIEEAGSGVIIQHGGKYYTLTNRHVVRESKPEAIKINLADGRVIHPSHVWTDPETDIAVMFIESNGIAAAELGDSDQLDIGDFVLAMGSPFGLSHSVTFGIVSATGRRDLQLGDASVKFQEFLQTDAAINPGNSGGPLVNLRGQVVGINTAIASNSGGNEGIGFSIPINMFMIVARQLIESGKVDRAFLGVRLDGKFGPAMAAEIGLPFPLGARVTALTESSPAAEAGLQIGDVILQFDGIRVEDDAHLMNLVSLTGIEQKMPLLIFRDGEAIAIEVEMGNRADFQKTQ